MLYISALGGTPVGVTTHLSRTAKSSCSLGFRPHGDSPKLTVPHGGVDVVLMNLARWVGSEPAVPSSRMKTTRL